MKIIILLIATICMAQPPAVEDLKVGEWTAVPMSTLIMVSPPQDLWPNIQRNFGVSGVMGAWSGGVYDPVHDAFIVWGGGHNAYGGNEVYRFLMQELKWERVNDPTANPNRCSGEAEPGVPISRHTYGGLAYITHANRFFGMGGSPDCGAGGCGLSTPWTFDFEQAKWYKMNPSGDKPGTGCEDNCVYWEESKKVYFHANGHGSRGWFAYDYSANNWTRLNSLGDSYGRSVALDPKRKVIVEIGAGASYKYDLNSPTLARTTLSPSGDNFITGKSNPGLAYDPVSDRIVGWFGGADVYSLNLDNNTWTKHPPASTNFITPTQSTASGGVYGRFQYVPTRNVFVCVNSVYEPVFIYKLTSESGSVVSEYGYRANSLKLEVSPNPFNSGVKIKVEGNGNGKRKKIYLKIYNINGKLVKDFSSIYLPSGRRGISSTFYLQAAGLPLGIYLAKLTIGKIQTTKRLFLVK